MDFIKGNEQPLIAAGAVLLGAIIAGFFALMGNILNNLANKKIRDDQFATEKWKSNRTLFIEKGEEVVALISSISNEFTSFVNLSALDSVCGTEGKIAESVKDQLAKKELSGLLERLDTLIVLYFSSFIQEKDNLVSTYHKGIRTYLEYVLNHSSKDEAIIELLVCLNTIKTLSEDLKRGISKEISMHF